MKYQSELRTLIRTLVRTLRTLIRTLRTLIRTLRTLIRTLRTLFRTLIRTLHITHNTNRTSIQTAVCTEAEKQEKLKMQRTTQKTTPLVEIS